MYVVKLLSYVNSTEAHKLITIIKIDILITPFVTVEVRKKFNYKKYP